MLRGIATLWKLDRLLLAIYLIALLVILMFPIPGSEYQLFSVGVDKWMHAALFGGLAVFLRWNLSADRHAVLVSVGAAFVVAVATELAQGLVVYRSAELLDLLAGLVGAILGAVSMNRILSSPMPEKRVGLLVAALACILHE